MSKSLRKNYSAENLDSMYRECQDPKLKERILAIKMVYGGRKVTEVAKDLSLSYKTVYNWLDKWNEGGVEGLIPQKRGKPREAYLKDEEWDEVIKEIQDKGYNLEQVRQYIQETREVNYSYKGVWMVLRKKRKVPYGKPYVINGKQSPTAAEELKKTRGSEGKFKRERSGHRVIG